MRLEIEEDLIIGAVATVEGSLVTILNDTKPMLYCIMAKTFKPIRVRVKI